MALAPRGRAWPAPWVAPAAGKPGRIDVRTAPRSYRGSVWAEAIGERSSARALGRAKRFWRLPNSPRALRPGSGTLRGRCQAFHQCPPSRKTFPERLTGTMERTLPEKKFGVGRHGRYLEVPWASTELSGTFTESSVHIRTFRFGFRVVHAMVIWVVTQEPWFNFFGETRPVGVRLGITSS